VIEMDVDAFIGKGKEYDVAGQKVFLKPLSGLENLALVLDMADDSRRTECIRALTLATLKENGFTEEQVRGFDLKVFLEFMKASNNVNGISG